MKMHSLRARLTLIASVRRRSHDLALLKRMLPKGAVVTWLTCAFGRSSL